MYGGSSLGIVSFPNLAQTMVYNAQPSITSKKTFSDIQYHVFPNVKARAFDTEFL